jgi:hypothetical protein
MNQLSPEEKATGQSNFYEAVGFTRREFMQGVVAAGAVSGGGLGAMYFGYQKVADPVRVVARPITFKWSRLQTSVHTVFTEPFMVTGLVLQPRPLALD